MIIYNELIIFFLLPKSACIEGIPSAIGFAYSMGLSEVIKGGNFLEKPAGIKNRNKKRRKQTRITAASLQKQKGI
jgi:hypothetical protein